MTGRRGSLLTSQRVFGAIGRLPIGQLYQFRLGWLLGHRFLVLTHIGRRSGARHQTVLEVLHYDADHRRAIVASGLGRESNWYRNLCRCPQAEVMIGRDRFGVLAQELEEDEAVAVLADYERRNRCIAPIVRLGLSWLVGWRYDSSLSARRRIARQLPLMALTARDTGREAA